MGQIIDARVFQKKDTLANWNANPLILGAGEQAFIISDVDAATITYKVGDGTKRFSDLPFPNYNVRDKATPSTVWTGKPSGVYLPMTDGVYNGVTVTLSDGSTVLYWDGTTIQKQITPVVVTGYTPTGGSTKTAKQIDDVAQANAVQLKTLNGYEQIPYSGVLGFRLYSDDTTFVTTSASNTQVDNGTSDTLNKTVSTTQSIYYNTLYTKVVGVTIRTDITLLSVTSGALGIGFINGSNVYQFGYTQTGAILKATPFTSATLKSGLATLAVGDVLTIEVKDGSISFYKNSVFQWTITDAQAGVGIMQLAMRGIISGNFAKLYKYAPTYASKATETTVATLTSKININHPFKADATFNSDASIAPATGRDVTWMKSFIKDIKLFGFPITDRISLFIVRRNSSNANKWQLQFFRDTGTGNGDSAHREIVLTWNDPTHVEPAAGVYDVIDHTEGGVGFKGYFNWAAVPVGDSGSITFNAAGFDQDVYINFSEANSAPVGPDGVSLTWPYSTTDATTTGTSLLKAYTVVPNHDADGAVVGSTGASYNTITDEYVISYYSYFKTSELWFYKRKDLVNYSSSGTITPVPTRKISLQGLIYHIQGNVHDPETNTYWVLGSSVAAPTGTQRRLIRVDDEANLIESYDLSMYDFEAGMVALSPDYKNLLIKPNNLSWILELDKVTKVQVRQVATNGGEGMGVDYQNGFVYTAGDTGTLYKRKYSDFSVVATWSYETLPNSPSTNQNVEGIIIDPIDGCLVMVFDAFLHGANNNGNCLFVFDFEHRALKQVNFPYMYSLDTDVSPVIDFGAVNVLTIAQLLAGTGTIEYRGSATAPTSLVVNRANWRDRPFYNSWGATVPSSWSSVFVANRYMQVRVV